MKRSRKLEKTKVILDTSCCLASILSKASTSAKIIEAMIKGKIFNFYSEEILGEVQEVLTREKFNLEKEKQDHFLHVLQEISFEVQQLDNFKVKQCRDPNDDKFLSLANQIDADFIITLDNDLLVLKTIGKTRIVTPVEFLKINDRIINL